MFYSSPSNNAITNNYYIYRIQLEQRKGAKRTMAKGIFPNSEVVRGHDWLWGDQDGKS